MNFEDILFLKKNVRDLIQTLEFLQSHELV
jgi:hypothetical protein